MTDSVSVVRKVEGGSQLNHDLIETPLLTYGNRMGEVDRTTLPGVLSRLLTGELSDFTRLRSHQIHPWMMFLTQLAAIAVRRSGAGPPVNEREWRDLLLRLTNNRHEPWCLSVEDLASPAFFQPPIPEETIEGWRECHRPDDIDVLVTSKGHDVKSGLIASNDVESWFYALATLQTMQGYPGRGYTGVARMNGGYGNRPRVGLAPDETLTSRFGRDLEVLLSSWPSLLGRGYSDDGVALVWTEPWDGKTSLGVSELAPHFIEVCWRVRCFESAAGVSCRYTTTTRRRCAPEIDNGDVGDPWAPVERNKGVLSVGHRGFHYDLMRRLLFESDFEPATAQSLRENDPDPMLFIAAALARGQGKTDGLHERVLSLSGPARWRLGQPDTRAALGRRASDRVVAAHFMRSKVLYPALKRLAPASEVRDEFDDRVDDAFFDDLFVTLEDDDEGARLAWESRLRDIARVELERAIARPSVPGVQRWRAVSAAESLFANGLARNFPDLARASSLMREGAAV